MPQRFSVALLALHWVTAFALIVGVASIEIRDLLSIENPIRPYLKQSHYLLGTLVFILLIVRVYVRATNPIPPSLSKRWKTLAARTVQSLLYFLMIFQPVVGTLTLQSGGGKLALFGWTVPPMIYEDAALHDSLKHWHEWGGNIFMVLALIHIAGALHSHYFVRDHTLKRMVDFRASS